MATKLNKFLLVALLGAFGLTACNDDITSYPSEGAILPPTDSANEIYHNDLKSIYESIRDGSLSSDVLEKLLYEYANSIFGKFSSNSPSYSSANDELTLTEAHAKARDDEARKSFIRKHKAYWSKDSEPASEEEWASANDKLDAIFESIEGRIAEQLYNKISGGAYSDHNIFEEKKFLTSLYFEGKQVANYTSVSEFYEGILNPEVKAKDAFIKGTTGFLHKEYYYSDENGYAVKEFIESIYKELLTEQYILDESYSTLGRSYARKVNVLSLTIDSANKADVPGLVDYLINHVIASKADYATDVDRLVFDETLDRRGEEAVKAIFDQVSNINRGLPQYFAEANFAKRTVDYLYKNYGLYGDTTVNAEGDAFTSTTGYLTSTEYGSMKKELAKINEELSLTDSSVESSYTGSGAYPISVGQEYKETEISLKNYVTNGWHIKNGGLSSLPESIRNRLFNISVANALDSTSVENNLVDRTDSTWTYDGEMEINRYVAKVNGAYFLKAETVEDKNSNKDLYFYDTSSATYYFVQIIEAVNPAKLSKESDRYGDLKETIAREVVEIVGEISSYSTLAKEHWLKKMELEYHDSKVYDYFKSNYPKLFE